MNDLKKNPKYSILIPTRNREEYLPFAIESVLSQNRDDVELIVSDNFSKDSTSNYLAGLSDCRLMVVRPPSEMPMSRHYEYILSQATGEWVTILGDDDAVMPYLFERLDSIIDKYPSSSIISSERANYFWEGCEDLYGEVVVSYRKGMGMMERSTKKDLFWAIAGMRSIFDMPMIYTTCLVKKSLIMEIKEGSGCFYHSIIPDIYSVVALSLMAGRYVRVEEPLFWVGTSNKSMARSDRIYRDSEIQTNANESESYAGRRLELNSNISYKLHSAGLDQYYLYEALCQCPLAKDLWRGKLLATIVFSSLILLVKKMNSYKAGASRKDLIDTIQSEAKRNAISPFLIILCMLVLRVIESIKNIQSIPHRVWRKLTKNDIKSIVISTNRNDFPTIKEASKAVLELYKK